ncbi:uncharacterized protein LOC134184541 isoform X2 [Corticium candelabrum]|uniref:uncharacterized protein LOC134184541 isoform X2 n=1 Tax=Corticium candelabrum TaxID=121492 RepID=UPI002E35CDDF|nr:uncharacterized protein LOC134184541 isoform X2 [Corticium candelabrum]
MDIDHRAEYGDYENGESAAESGAQLGFVNDYIWHSHIPLRGRLLSEPGLNSATMLVDHEQTFSRMSAGIEAALDRVFVQMETLVDQNKFLNDQVSVQMEQNKSLNDQVSVQMEQNKTLNDLVSVQMKTLVEQNKALNDRVLKLEVVLSETNKRMEGNHHMKKNEGKEESLIKEVTLNQIKLGVEVQKNTDELASQRRLSRSSMNAHNVLRCECEKLTNQVKDFQNRNNVVTKENGELRTMLKEERAQNITSIHATKADCNLTSATSHSEIDVSSCGSEVESSRHREVT